MVSGGPGVVAIKDVSGSGPPVAAGPTAYLDADSRVRPDVADPLGGAAMLERSQKVSQARPSQTGVSRGCLV